MSNLRGVAYRLKINEKSKKIQRISFMWIQIIVKLIDLALVHLFTSRESPPSKRSKFEWGLLKTLQLENIWGKDTINSLYKLKSVLVYSFFSFALRFDEESDCFNTTQKTGLEQIDLKSSSKSKLASSCARLFFPRLLVFTVFLHDITNINTLLIFIAFFSCYTFFFLVWICDRQSYCNLSCNLLQKHVARGFLNHTKISKCNTKYCHIHFKLILKILVPNEKNTGSFTQIYTRKKNICSNWLASICLKFYFTKCL